MPSPYTTPGVGNNNYCESDGAVPHCSGCGGCVGLTVMPSPSPMPSPEPSPSHEQPPPGSVLCPGLPVAHYCDCGGDCTNQPSWCSCAGAQTCCAAPMPPPPAPPHSSPHPLPSCVNEAVWNGGYGLCSTYYPGSGNFNYCAGDGAVPHCSGCGGCIPPMYPPYPPM